MVLVKHLPREASVWGHAHWTTADELAAQAVEMADAWGRAQFALLHLLVFHKAPSRSMLEPYRIEHPGRPVSRKQPVEHDSAAIKAFFEKF